MDQKDQPLLVILKILIFLMVLHLQLVQWVQQNRPVLQDLELQLDQVVLYFLLAPMVLMGQVDQYLLTALMVH